MSWIIPLWRDRKLPFFCILPFYDTIGNSPFLPWRFKLFNQLMNNLKIAWWIFRRSPNRHVVYPVPRTITLKYQNLLIAWWNCVINYDLAYLPFFYFIKFKIIVGSKIKVWSFREPANGNFSMKWKKNFFQQCIVAVFPPTLLSAKTLLSFFPTCLSIAEYDLAHPCSHALVLISLKKGRKIREGSLSSCPMLSHWRKILSVSP